MKKNLFTFYWLILIPILMILGCASEPIIHDYGIHGNSKNPANLSILRIIAKEGMLTVRTFNNEEVEWSSGENKKGNVVQIPSGENNLTLTYTAFRPSQENMMTSGGLIGLTNNIVMQVKRKNAPEHDTDKIILNYNFYPGAEYDLVFVKDKSKNKSYAAVEVIPRIGAPSRQAKGYGSTTPTSPVAASATASTSISASTAISYYFNLKNNPVGPYTINELKEFSRKGEFTKNSLVWKEGMPQWVRAETVNELSEIWKSLPPPLPPPLPSR